MLFDGLSEAEVACYREELVAALRGQIQKLDDQHRMAGDAASKKIIAHRAVRCRELLKHFSEESEIQTLVPAPVPAVELAIEPAQETTLALAPTQDPTQ